MVNQYFCHNPRRGTHDVSGMLCLQVWLPKCFWENFIVHLINSTKLPHNAGPFDNCVLPKLAHFLVDYESILFSKLWKLQWEHLCLCFKDEGKECIICYEALYIYETSRLGCGHDFHKHVRTTVGWIKVWKFSKILKSSVLNSSSPIWALWLA